MSFYEQLEVDEKIPARVADHNRKRVAVIRLNNAEFQAFEELEKQNAELAHLFDENSLQRKKDHRPAGRVGYSQNHP